MNHKGGARRSRNQKRTATGPRSQRVASQDIVGSHPQVGFDRDRPLAATLAAQAHEPLKSGFGSLKQVLELEEQLRELATFL